MTPRRVLALPLFAALAACSAAPKPPPRAPLADLRLELTPFAVDDTRLADARALEVLQPAQSLFDRAMPAPEAEPEAPPDPAPRLRLDAGVLDLPAGRSVLDVVLPPHRLVSLGVFGPQDALLGFDLAGPRLVDVVRAHGAIDEDGLLPHVTSFATGPGEAPTLVQAIVDVSEPVRVARASVDPDTLHADDDAGDALPLIGLPAPTTRDDGYLLGRAGRYEFARADVALTLVSVMRDVRRRFRRDPIEITDITQWDGQRPGVDVGAPRHRSHAAGRDVDIALPANDGAPSTLRLHCTGERAPWDHYACVPGSARGVDMNRLAYMLGRFVAVPGRVEAIFLDTELIAGMRNAAETLGKWRLLDPGTVGTLGDDRLVRHLPWHTDHVHVRFSGARGRPTLAPPPPPEPEPADDEGDEP